MARLRYNFSVPSGSSSGDPQKNLTKLGLLLAVGVFFVLPMAPPLGLIWCTAVGKALFDNLKKQEIVKKNVEGKLAVDWNRAKTAGKQSAADIRTYSKKAADEVRTYSRESARKYKDRISERDMMEERKPYRHSHTPVNYSYDACAKDRRLEQIKSLKDAGIIDEKEYQERRAKIMAGR